MRRSAHFLIALSAALMLAACNFPIGDREAPSEATTAAPDDTGDESPATEEAPGGGNVTQEPSGAENEPAPTGEVVVPDGWTEYGAPELGVALYIPPGWEAIVVNENKLDIREIDSFAWMEINLITTDTDDSWSLVYTPGSAPAAILGEIVQAAQEDGDFDEPYPLADGTVWATQGVYDVLEEPVFIGAVDQSDRMLLVLGHALASDDWGGDYLPLYESMIQTITTGN